MRGLRTEPVLVSGLVAAVLALLVEFGVPVTPGQQTAIQSVIAAVFLLLARSQVTSDATLERAGTTRQVVAAVAEHHDAHLLPVVEGRVHRD